MARPVPERRDRASRPRGPRHRHGAAVPAPVAGRVPSSTGSRHRSSNSRAVAPCRSTTRPTCRVPSVRVQDLFGVTVHPARRHHTDRPHAALAGRPPDPGDVRSPRLLERLVDTRSARTWPVGTRSTTGRSIPPPPHRSASAITDDLGLDDRWADDRRAPDLDGPRVHRAGARRCRRAGGARDRHGNDRVAVADARGPRLHPGCDRDLRAATQLGGGPAGAPPHRSARGRPGAARAGTGRGARGDRHRLGGAARTGLSRFRFGAARRRRVGHRRAVPPDPAGVGDRRRHVRLHRYRHRCRWTTDGDHLPERRSAASPERRSRCSSESVP